MSDNFTPELRKELLDDFYAEYDELLTAIRSGLEQLESLGLKSPPHRETLEGLFRSTHTLKGISSIAGLRPAEKLAHAMEDVFRVLSRRALPVSKIEVDTLLAAAQRLEKIVVCHRMAKAMPETAGLLDELRLLVPVVDETKKSADSPAKEEPAPATDRVEAARSRGLSLFLATFTPSAELDKRGVNVNSVRGRLNEIGEILKASPLVRGKGSIVFEFTVGLRKVPADFSSWEADGISFSTVPDPPAATQVKDLSEPADLEVLSLTPSHIVRVDLARLDDLMRITGELVILRSKLEDQLQQRIISHAGLKEVNLAMSRSLREMREAVTRVRMVPIAEIFARIPFVVRELLRGSDKKVRVVLEGNQTEVDKYLVERLKEPLLHLVRNAFAHGIEPTGVRESAGKAAEAVITLRAKSAGESVVIQIRDDGRGIDAAKVAARATALGINVPQRLDAGGLLTILCAPGFSTREAADFAAGRGVGMAVVANTVRELGGTLTLENWPGGGAEFTLKLPLTLSIADAIMVVVGDEICAVPQSAVEEIIQVPATEVRSIKQAEVIPYRGGLLPLVRLRKMFSQAPQDTTTLTLLVVSSERGATGLLVDRVRAQREIVIRPLTDPLLHVPGISGATELGDGRPILILDPNVITQGVVRPAGGAEPLDPVLNEARAS